LHNLVMTRPTQELHL